ncbi:hypothetical protein FBD94_05025 [Pedobacter hiemivivus]|uniref:Uncharacterized protein n=1 Tax=Pedobacter hiemivivus TaxID=2530454 RepID=A0A4U1GPM2_9SPHI|nr:hypothetical protein [Pedobacter hiemivivus]TKC63712.1 hypothetical protein FBD94_05025 [Pedobacter hiemivivus]
MRRPPDMTLQKLVLERMSPRTAAMSNEEIERWIAALPEINDEIIHFTRQTVFGSLPDRLVIRHLNHFCMECTLMLNALYDYSDRRREMEQLYEMVLNCVLVVFESHRQNYRKYLDLNVSMPIILYHEAAQKIENGIALMVTAMTRYHAHKTLQAIVISKMSNLLKNGTGTWHQVSYLEKLQQYIMKLCTGGYENINVPLWHLLVAANFNTSGFIAYCKSCIEEDIAGNYEIRDQYDCLYRHQRELTILFNYPEFLKFEPKQPKVKEVLLQYVNSELNIMDRKYRMVNENKVVDPVAPRSRVSVSISVDALAYFFRLLTMAEVTTCSKNELILFISRNFRTPGAGEGDLSLKSIENKYRQVVRNTAITLKSILSKMLKQLNEEFK